MQGFKLPDRKFALPDIPELAGTRIAHFLKGMGIDLGEVTGFVVEILQELRAHNERLERMEQKLDRIVERQLLHEQVLIATSPEARMMLGDAAALANNPATQSAYSEKGMIPISGVGAVREAAAATNRLIDYGAVPNGGNSNG